MRILALVPDPRSAYGLSEALAALPRPSLRVVAYGQATAAALPAGLDVMVYPVREGSVLPAPFLDALIVHESADVLLAPAGSVPAPPVPALVVDLDHAVPAEKVVPRDEPGQASWIEALTDDVERRRALLRAGLFSVELNPGAFERAGRLAATSASAILGRLIDMAGLSTRPQPRKPAYPRPVEAVNSAAPLPEAPPLARPHVAPVLPAPGPSTPVMSAPLNTAPLITAPVTPVVPVAPLAPVKPVAPPQPALSTPLAVTPEPPLVVKSEAPLVVKAETPLVVKAETPIVKIVQVTSHPPLVEHEDVTEPLATIEPTAPHEGRASSAPADVPSAKSAFSLVTPIAPSTNEPATSAPSTPYSIPMTAGAFTPILSAPLTPIAPAAPVAPAAPIANVAPSTPAAPIAPTAPAHPADAPRGPATPVEDRESAGLYRDRCINGRVLVLASAIGLDGISAALLGEATVIAVPESVAWLSSRMGLAQFVCATAQPRTLEAAAATSAVRTVLVHADHLDGATIAPRARARVAVRDLSRAGWPALGWSDELETGYFPGPGDVGLALQWAAWLGATEIVLAGAGPLETRPSWPEFLAGAAELLAAREGRIVILGTQAAPSLPQAEVRDRFTRWGSGRG